MNSTKKATRNAIPYAKIVSMLQQGKTIKQIAVAIDRYNEKADDPTKPVRAIISRMRTIGYTNSKGEFVKFKAGKKGTRVYDAFQKPHKVTVRPRAAKPALAVAATA